MEDEAGTAEIIDDERAPQFSAFISYSHADAAEVRKLHSQIESYRLPADLGSIDALNRRKGRIGKVFRDREDLSAAQDLSAAVKDVLARSQVLIVACSPDARASQWVDQEIAYFRERHPHRPILAAILRGEPDEAFPAALIADGAEPLAADLRKQGDGWRLGFLKVVAGIAGVPLDRLVQRDSQRQVRRVMAVTGLVALVAVAMGVMTTIALQARNEADLLRASSDAFIDELLTDGREDLISVGRLDILDKFNDRALRFYERQGDVARLPADSLENWARILHAMGEDEIKKSDGNLSTALRIFRSAHRSTQELASRQPSNPDFLAAHGNSQYWMGWVAENKSDFNKARAWYEAYHASSERLWELEPNSPRSALELAYSTNNLGILDLNGERFADAERQFKRAIEWFSVALASAEWDPTVAAELANARAWLASTHYQSGDLRRSRSERERQRTDLERILDREPKNTAFQYKLLVCDYAILKIDERLGAIGIEPRKSLLLQRIAALRRIDPKNQVWTEMERKISSI